jgi:UTP--glucose-1-phosphate uridylyltransferase
VKIKKAVITAAGKRRGLPLQSLVDSDGVVKSALRIILEEARSAGIEDVCVVVNPNDQEPYRAAAGEDICFVEQDPPRGYGHAVWSARHFVGDDPFLHAVCDHLWVSREKRRSAQQLVETAAAEACAVSAVQATREDMLPYYGTVGGKRVPGKLPLYAVENVIEKPTPTLAEQQLIVPGLRAGHYLCFFGMHVLTPTVMEILENQAELSPALKALAGREKYLALEVAGVRYDLGAKYGLLIAQMALALEGQDRGEVLAELVNLLASDKRR